MWTFFLYKLIFCHWYSCEEVNRESKVKCCFLTACRNPTKFQAMMLSGRPIAFFSITISFLEEPQSTKPLTWISFVFIFIFLMILVSSIYSQELKIIDVFENPFLLFTENLFHSPNNICKLILASLLLLFFLNFKILLFYKNYIKNQIFFFNKNNFKIRTKLNFSK